MPALLFSQAGRAGCSRITFVLADTNLGAIPVDDLMTWPALMATCGPVAQMVARGIVPEKYADMTKVIDRWGKAADPARTAKDWFRENPVAKRQLDAIHATHKATLFGVEFDFIERSLGTRGRRCVQVADWVAADPSAARTLAGLARLDL